MFEQAHEGRECHMEEIKLEIKELEKRIAPSFIWVDSSVLADPRILAKAAPNNQKNDCFIWGE
jgi:hypothetical protein